MITSNVQQHISFRDGTLCCVKYMPTYMSLKSLTDEELLAVLESSLIDCEVCRTIKRKLEEFGGRSFED